MRRLTWSEISALRGERWRAALLVLTDRCTVGCAHCSVDARADSARVTDFGLLEELVEGLCAERSFQAIGVTGGEPFSEARALSYVAERTNECGKPMVLYTSGVWAGGARHPAWVRQVLERTSCVVLGADRYHARRLPSDCTRSAVRAVADAGAWLVVQTIGGARERAEAECLIADALGPDWTSRAEVNMTPALPYGRGSKVFAESVTAPRTGRELGRCALVETPTVRFDGVVTACCDERVLAGAGPSGLRRRVRDRAELAEVLAQLRDDAYFRLLGRAGTPVLTRLPRFADLADEEFRQICGVCWRAVARLDALPEPDPMLLAASGLPAGAGR
jgi:hypothetical protein